MVSSVRVAGLAVCLVAASVVPAAATTPGVAAAGYQVSSASKAGTAALITGDSVQLVTAHGRSTAHVRMTARTGVAATYTTFQYAGRDYVVPGAARRYLDTVLDRSLFDVTTLATAKNVSTLAVNLTTAAGQTPNVPGLTVTSRTTTGESGYFTTAGRKQFGAALVSQAVKDAAAHRVSTTLFGGMTRMVAADAAPVVTPAFQQYTLQVKMVDPTGAPVDFAFVALMNTDDGAKFTAPLFLVRGLAKISVPAGNYSGIAEYDNFADRQAITSYLVPFEGIDVERNNQTLLLDSRTATTVPSVRTPRPGTLQSETLEWDRDTPNSGVSVASTFGSGADVHVTPVHADSGGSLHWLASWSLLGAPTSGTPYSYDLSYASSGEVPADQTHIVSTDQLAVVNSAYYTDAQPRSAAFGRGASYPFQFFGSVELFGMPTPTARTEYLNTPPGATWTSILLAAPSDFDPFQGLVEDTRTYAAGSTQHIDWLRGPLAPGIVATPPGQTAQFCSACRDGKTMLLAFAPYIDTTPGHAGTFDLLDDRTVAARFQVYRNGKLILDEPNSVGDLLPVPTVTSTYRAVVTQDRGLVGFATSTSATEDVTFVSGAGQGPPVPRPTACPGPSRTCTGLPLLTATVPLPTDLFSVMPIGRSTTGFTVGHVQGAAPSAISGVKFEMSTNDGASYQSLPVTVLGGGRYQATLVNPAAAAGHGVTIRVSASDAAGGHLVETVHNAYYIAQS